MFYKLTNKIMFPGVPEDENSYLIRSNNHSCSFPVFMDNLSFLVLLIAKVTLFPVNFVRKNGIKNISRNRATETGYK